MRKLSMIAVAALAFLGLTGTAYAFMGASTASLAVDDYVGISFWLVTMGMLALPSMLKAGYDEKIETGTICAAGTLGQIIPPSIVLILLAEMLQGANEEAGLMTGDLAPLQVTAIDLFAGALIPGLILVGMFIVYILIVAKLKPSDLPILQSTKTKAEKIRTAVFEVIPPIFLILSVLGSIFMGIATPTESASVGAAGTALLALFRKELNYKNVSAAAITTVKMSSFVFIILDSQLKLVYRYRSFKSDSKRPDQLNAYHALFTKPVILTLNTNTPNTYKIHEVAMNWF